MYKIFNYLTNTFNSVKNLWHFSS